MKFTHSILSIAVLLSGLLIAQDEGKMNPKDRAKMQTERLTENLGLSPDQAEKVHAINLKYAQTADEKMGKAKADEKKGKHRKGVKKHLKARDKEIRSVLNKDQKKSLKKMRIHQKEKMQDKRKKRKAHKRGGKGKRPQ